MLKFIITMSVSFMIIHKLIGLPTGLSVFLSFITFFVVMVVTDEGYRSRLFRNTMDGIGVDVDKLNQK